jgi:hypothetical protein
MELYVGSRPKRRLYVRSGHHGRRRRRIQRARFLLDLHVRSGYHVRRRRRILAGLHVRRRLVAERHVRRRRWMQRSIMPRRHSARHHLHHAPRRWRHPADHASNSVKLGLLRHLRPLMIVQGKILQCNFPDQFLSFLKCRRTTELVFELQCFIHDGRPRRCRRKHGLRVRHGRRQGRTSRIRTLRIRMLRVGSLRVRTRRMTKSQRGTLLCHCGSTRRVRIRRIRKRPRTMGRR